MYFINIDDARFIVVSNSILACFGAANVALSFNREYCVCVAVCAEFILSNPKAAFLRADIICVQTEFGIFCKRQRNFINVLVFAVRRHLEFVFEFVVPAVHRAFDKNIFAYFCDGQNLAVRVERYVISSALSDFDVFVILAYCRKTYRADNIFRIVLSNNIVPGKCFVGCFVCADNQLFVLG